MTPEMKASLLIVTLTMLTAVAPVLGMSELEELRSRCAAQEAQIRKLEQQVQSLQPRDTRAESAKARQQAENSPTATYTVRKGDSLERIARRFNCTPEAIARSNRLNMSSVIHPGQKLTVPGASGEAVNNPAAIPKTYKIQEGDTYSRISRRTGIAVDRLIAANPEVKATAMRPGQVIQLPRESVAAKNESAAAASRRTQASTETKETSQAGTAMSATQDPVETPPSPTTAERRIRPVMIDGEMTYGEFASRHGTNPDRLNDLNGLDLTSATVLARGSELYVPAQP